jgi:hypothetical protein
MSAEQQNKAPATESNYRLPSDITLKHAAKLGIVEDKPNK